MPVDDKVVFNGYSNTHGNILKRKHKTLNGNADESFGKASKKKKLEKKFLQNGDRGDNGKPYVYKNTDNYVQAIAKSELQCTPPQLFKLNFAGNNQCKSPKSFLSSILTGRSLDTSIYSRFSALSSSCSGVGDAEESFSLAQSPQEKKGKNEVLKKKTKHKKKIKPNPEPEEEDGVWESSEQRDTTPKHPDHFIVTENEAERQEVDSGVSYADFYEVPHAQALVLHLHHPSRFSFHGELKFTLIAGSIEILGYTLNESSKRRTVEAYSPELYTPLVVESKESQDQSGIQWKLTGVLSKDTAALILDNYKPNDVILMVEQLVSDTGKIIHRYTDLALFPKNLQDFSSLSKSVQKLQSTFKFDPSKTENEFMKDEKWDELPMGGCTVLCGGKNVGKSTLLRYYINRFVSNDERILVLDFDPGQPEFTPPGYVSAIVVDKPVLGPNFTHVTEPELMVYFGGINTSKSPSKYLESVNHVIQWCRNNEKFSQMKWLVNTMGFSKGLGVELMISIFKLLRPTTVVEIVSTDDGNNYPFRLTPSAVSARNGFGALPYENEVDYEHWTVNSRAEINHKQIRRLLFSSELRSIMMLSYLGQMLEPPYLSFNAVQPYVISFSKLYLGIDFLINPIDAVKAFNGNLVSLMHFERTTETVLSADSEDDSNFQIVVKPKVGPSFGLGFVRGIDCKRKRFYLLTHLPLDVLKNVNCLALGRISAPNSLFLKQDIIQGRTPYTNISTSDTVQRVKRMFRTR